jgi:phage terminase small subunit
MGRSPKPTSQLAPDAFRKNPKRARPAEPIPNGPLGAPPKHLTAKEKATWRELESIAPAKVLTNADRWVVEIACRLMAKLRAEGIGGRSGVSVGEMTQLNQCLSRMGLTPADRPKIAVAKDDEKKNAFASLDDEPGISGGSRPN